MLTITFSYTETAQQDKFIRVSMRPNILLLTQLDKLDNAPTVRYFITENSPILSDETCKKWLVRLKINNLDLDKIDIRVQGYGQCPSQKVIEKKDVLLNNFEKMKQTLTSLENQLPKRAEIDTNVRGNGTLAKLDVLDYLLHEELEAMDYAYLQTILPSCVGVNLFANITTYPLHPQSLLKNTRIPGSATFNQLTDKQLDQLAELKKWATQFNNTFDAATVRAQLPKIIHELRQIEDTHQKAQQDQMREAYQTRSTSAKNLARIEGRFLPIQSLQLHSLLRAALVNNTHLMPIESLWLYVLNHPLSPQILTRLSHQLRLSISTQVVSVVPTITNAPTATGPRHESLLSTEYFNTGFLLKCLCAGLITCALVALILSAVPAVAVVLPVSAQTLQYTAYASIAVGGLGLFTQSACGSKVSAEPVATFNQYCG